MGENQRRERVKEKKKMNKGLKVLLIIFIIILVLLLIAAGVVGAGYYYIHQYIHQKIGKTQQIVINDTDLNIAQEVEENLEEYRNIAIFGVDSRANDYGEGNRSDCIIIVSINNKTKEVRLASVYRDTYVQIEGYGLDKITHAYSYGEAPLALGTLNTNLDLNIKEFVTVNFDSVAKAINAIGGVEINITSEEIKYINSYITETSRVTGISSKQITQPGKQLLDGVQAVSYGRIRYTEGGDYKRTERMRDVIIAAFERLKTKSIGELNSLLDEILPEVYTNITASDVISMIPHVMKYKVVDSIGWPYEQKSYTNPVWYGVPVTLESNVTKLHKELFGEEDYVPSEKLREISNKIIKKTGYK